MVNIPLVSVQGGLSRGSLKNRHFLRFTLHLWVQISQNPTLFTLKCTQGILSLILWVIYLGTWGDLAQFEALFISQKPKKSSFFEIYPSPVGTDQSESNPIHLEMYTGNIIFNFMGDIPRYWGDLAQFEALFISQKPKNRHFLRFTLHLWVQISQNPTLFTLKCTQGI